MVYNFFKIEDIATVKSGKRLPKGHVLTQERTNYPYIRLVDIKDNRVSNKNIQFLERDTYEKISNYIVEENNVCLAIVGHTIGLVFYIEKEFHKSNLTENAVRLIINSNVNSKYVYYYLMSKIGQEQILSRKVGSAQGKLPIYGVKSIEIALPPLEVQNKIVKILDLLDEKYRVNLKIIGNLEKISEQIFKRWFIDFEFLNEQGLPYRSSGGEMIESEIGKIPKSFIKNNFSSLNLETIGGDWGKESLQGNYTCEVSILRGADIPEVKRGKSGKVPIRYILEKNYLNKKLFSNDIVIEISGGSPTQSTGRVTYINQEILNRYNDKLLCTNFCRVMRPKTPQTGLFIYMYMNYLYEENVFFSYENGTTGIKNFDLNSFMNFHFIPMPPEELIVKFNNIIEKYFKYIQELGNENMKLEELRDTLIPKLLSGEIEIPDESVVEPS